MPVNVEVKARVRNLVDLEMKLLGMADAPAEMIHQNDTFFDCPSGRLKLRRLKGDRGQLIFYHRPDASGPRESHYMITETFDPKGLEAVLQAAYGTRAVVRKRRLHYQVGQTRVHLDKVEGLGSFLELEVVLQEGQSTEEGQRVAQRLMKQLGIRAEDLIPVAYVDLLQTPDP